jgi:hypothetical protein
MPGGESARSSAILILRAETALRLGVVWDGSRGRYLCVPGAFCFMGFSAERKFGTDHTTAEFPAISSGNANSSRQWNVSISRCDSRGIDGSD